MTELEPIGPQEALELYLDHRRREVADATLKSHKSRLSHFIDWCEENEIGNLNELSGRQIHQFRIWRRNRDGGIKSVTENGQMDTLRVFIRFIESIDGVRQDLSEQVQSPTLGDKEDARDVMLPTDRAEAVLDYLTKYEYASRAHTVLALLWDTSMRRGAVRALDVDDYDPDEQYIEVRHRPETDTPLKNKEDGERMVALRSHICEVLDDWISTRRPEKEDEFGREPLIATRHGRIHSTSVTSIVYAWTRPCVYSGTCPLERDPDECPATQHEIAHECPESVSSHAVRRGSITQHLESDVPRDVVSGRANVGAETLDKHYDQRGERTKMEQRREHLDDR